MLLKNLTFGDYIIGLPWIIFNEGVRVIYAFFFESQTRARLISGIGLIPKMLRKRKHILKRQLKPEREIRGYVE